MKNLEFKEREVKNIILNENISNDEINNLIQCLIDEGTLIINGNTYVNSNILDLLIKIFSICDFQINDISPNIKDYLNKELEHKIYTGNIFKKLHIEKHGENADTSIWDKGIEHYKNLKEMLK